MLTDWISEIVLNNCGPDVYDRWIAARSPGPTPASSSRSACSRSSSQPSCCLGGTDRILATGDDVTACTPTRRPPTCAISHRSPAQRTTRPRTRCDYDVFAFPSIKAEHQGAVTIIPVMLSARRSVVHGLPRERPGPGDVELRRLHIPVRTGACPRTPTPDGREQVSSITRFSAGDVVPPSLQRAWGGGRCWTSSGTRGSLDSILSLSRSPRAHIRSPWRSGVRRSDDPTAMEIPGTRNLRRVDRGSTLPDLVSSHRQPRSPDPSAAPARSARFLAAVPPPGPRLDRLDPARRRGGDPPVRDAERIGTGVPAHRILGGAPVVTSVAPDRRGACRAAPGCVIGSDISTAPSPTCRSASRSPS